VNNRTYLFPVCTRCSSQVVQRQNGKRYCSSCGEPYTEQADAEKSLAIPKADEPCIICGQGFANHIHCPNAKGNHAFQRAGDAQGEGRK